MPERAIRFGVRNDAGLRSGTWKCFWPGNANDQSFYVACRELHGGDFKLSFHQTGECNVSFTERTHRRFEKGAAPRSRYLEWWQRPDPFRPGMTQVCNVVVPGGAATEPPRQGDDNDVTWVQDPGQGRAIEFAVIVAEPGRDNWQGLFLIESFCFPSGGLVGVTYNESAYAPPPPQHGTAHFVEGGRDLLASAPGLRAITLGIHEQTRLRIFTDAPANVTPSAGAPEP
jgi:hypothetical protein